jgi:hypothetical protein
VDDLLIVWTCPESPFDVLGEFRSSDLAEWLVKIGEAGVRRRAEQLYQQLDRLQALRQQARRELLAESRKHAITAKLRQIPYLGMRCSRLADVCPLYCSRGDPASKPDLQIHGELVADGSNRPPKWKCSSLIATSNKF